MFKTKEKDQPLLRFRCWDSPFFSVFLLGVFSAVQDAVFINLMMISLSQNSLMFK